MYGGYGQQPSPGMTALQQYLQQQNSLAQYGAPAQPAAPGTWNDVIPASPEGRDETGQTPTPGRAQPSFGGGMAPTMGQLGPGIPEGNPAFMGWTGGFLGGAKDMLGGDLARGAAQAGGALAGSMAAPVVGGIAGGWAGGKLADWLGIGADQPLSPNDPMFAGNSPWTPDWYTENHQYQSPHLSPGTELSPYGTQVSQMGGYMSPSGYVTGSMSPEAFSGSTSQMAANMDLSGAGGMPINHIPRAARYMRK